MSKLGVQVQEKPRPSKENIQHFKKLNLLTFSIFWVIFSLLDLEPVANLDPGSKTLLVVLVFSINFGHDLNAAMDRNFFYHWFIALV
jgi:hypothetical protein